MMPVVEVVIINWKRPKNVERIIRALKIQTVPCTITICDCHQNSEFSLSEDILPLVDRIFKWEHNLGAFSRYIPIASYDHIYTLFIDDDMLPGAKCLEGFLQAASVNPNFGVLGQMGRIVGRDGSYNVNNIRRENNNHFVEVDFVIRAYFTKTRNLHNLIKFRWEIGYFEEKHLEDDLLLCASLKYNENLRCFLIPYDNDPETLVNKEELNSEYALSLRNDHYYKRQDFIKRIMYYGWKPITDFDGTGNYKDQGLIQNKPCPKVSICMTVFNESEYINLALKQIYNWDCCHEIIIVEGFVGLHSSETRNVLSEDGTTEIIKNFPDPHKKIRYFSGTFRNTVEQKNTYAKEVTGSYVLVLDAAEFYSNQDLQNLKEDIVDNPDVDLFKFDFSHNPKKRTYYHLWHGFDTHMIGGYWDTPRNRIFKWMSGTRYTISSPNHPIHPNGTILSHNSVFITVFNTRAKCVHAGFAKKALKQSNNKVSYITFDKYNEMDFQLNKVKKMYIDSKYVWKNWTPYMSLPYNAQIFKFPHQLPELLIEHHTRMMLLK